MPMPDPPPTGPHRTPTGSVAPGYFDRLYLDQADPWDYATSPYEAAKYAATLVALPRVRYRRAVELGCSIGVLTRHLASRADALLGVDVSDAALDQGRQRCAGLGHVTFERRTLPAETPGGPFDLAVLSEVGYYLSRPDLDTLADRLAAAVVPGGHLLLVHWTGPTDYPQTADDVHARFLADARWQRLDGHRAPDYRLDVVARL